jgi:hypothetical protein
LFEQNDDNCLEADQCRGGDEPEPERRRSRPHQQPHDPPAQTARLAAVSLSDPLPCHMIGVARAMADRNIAGEVPTILPASR